MTMGRSVLVEEVVVIVVASVVSVVKVVVIKMHSYTSRLYHNIGS